MSRFLHKDNTPSNYGTDWDLSRTAHNEQLHQPSVPFKERIRGPNKTPSAEQQQQQAKLHAGGTKGPGVIRAAEGSSLEKSGMTHM